MRYQKILALVSLIISALCIVYALLFCTPIVEMSALTHAATAYANRPSPINGNDTYDLCQSVNYVLLILGVVFILIVAFVYITASNKRRNYYITNYISVIGIAAYAFAMGVLIIALTAACQNSFLTVVDWEAYREFVDDQIVQIVQYGDDMTVWYIGYALAVIVILSAAAWVLNLIWKIKLMKGEKALLQAGLAKEGA